MSLTLVQDGFTEVFDTDGEYLSGIVGTGEALLNRKSITSGVVDTGKEFLIFVNDTGEANFSDVFDTGEAPK